MLPHQGFVLEEDITKVDETQPDSAFLGATAKNAHGQTRPNSANERFIYYCRCLVGDYKEPEDGVHTNAAPEKPDWEDGLRTNAGPQKKKWVGYDSTVNRQRDPLLFCIYDADQVYPEYLIKYQCEKLP